MTQAVRASSVLFQIWQHIIIIIILYKADNSQKIRLNKKFFFFFLFQDSVSHCIVVRV